MSDLLERMTEAMDVDSDRPHTWRKRKAAMLIAALTEAANDEAGASAEAWAARVLLRGIKDTE